MLNYTFLTKRKFILSFWFVFLFLISSCHANTESITSKRSNLTSRISNLTLSSLNSQIFINFVADCNFGDIIYCAGTVFAPNSSGLSYSFEYSCSGQDTTFNFLVGNCISSYLYNSNLYCLNLTSGKVFTVLPDIATKDVRCI